jgi:hypothetical protein
MRETVAFLAVLGGVVEIIVAIGGPAAAGVGMETGQAAPPMPTGPLLVGIAIGVLSIAAGAAVALGRRGWPWGSLLVVVSVLGATVVGPLTGWFTMAAGFTVLAGVLALPIGLRPRLPARRRG